MAATEKKANAENASMHQLKETARVGSSETALRCTAIQMLIAEIPREKVCETLIVTKRSLQKWVSTFNERGIDGLITRKRSGRPKKISKAHEEKLVDLINNPQDADRRFWTVRAFHGCISDNYKIECSYETVVRFFHEKGFSLKVPRPWPDRQDEEKRGIFRKELKELCLNPDIDIWFADESGFEGESRPRRRWDKRNQNLCHS